MYYSTVRPTVLTKSQVMTDAMSFINRGAIHYLKNDQVVKNRIVERAAIVWQAINSYKTVYIDNIDSAMHYGYPMGTKIHIWDYIGLFNYKDSASVLIEFRNMYDKMFY